MPDLELPQFVLTETGPGFFRLSFGQSVSGGAKVGHGSGRMILLRAA
jgi:hypothetical protein